MLWIILLICLLQLVLLVFLLTRQKNTRKTVQLLEQVSALSKAQERLDAMLSTQATQLREEIHRSAQMGREDLHTNLVRFGDLMKRSVQDLGLQQKNLLDTFSKQLVDLTSMNENKLNAIRDTVEKRLHLLQQDNASKLEVMRQTVDEKLHATLEKRLGESFALVSERLELVHKGLGEMQSLASGVGDLKRVLSNVKTRGTLGEMQLENILEQILTHEQYEKNIATKSRSNDRVEFAIRLPGHEDDAIHSVLLPIDAKFPLEDYQRLVEAREQGDGDRALEAAKSLDARIKQEARSISDKYLDPPLTTDFALLFLPVEGLFAEVLSRPGLWESVQRDYRVIITGPTTITAFLNSLTMGFRTLAVQKRSSEVWQLLGAVKTEFGRFGEALEKTQKKLQEASNTMEAASTRSRVMMRKLKSVEALSDADTQHILPVDELVDLDG